MAERVPDDELRVGHPERERAITLLNDAFSSGYLEIAEFEERSGAIYASRTRGDLRAVLTDLPNAGHLFPTEPQAPASALAPAGGVAPARVHWTADWETLRRKGIWQVPTSVLITASWGTVDLDFTRATFPGPSVDLQLQISVSNVKLKLGAEHEFRDAGVVTSGLSNVKDKAGPPKRPGGAVIVVSGSLSGMSGLVIRRG